MSETGKLVLGAESRVSKSRTLKNMIDSAIEHKSAISVTIGDSIVGIGLDNRGDWTISIGLSLKSDRFQAISSGLQHLGFFQATENEGQHYFLWTSLLSQTENSKAEPERTLMQVLAQAVRILQETPIAPYIR